MDVTVVVATCGADEWVDLAHSRAIPSARALGVPVLHKHLPGGTVAQARNELVRLVGSEWVVHLDADDELAPGYVDALAQGAADLRAPAVQYLRPGWDPLKPRMPRVAGHDHRCVGECLRQGNWLVVGAAVRADLVRSVGGWREWPMYEDWDLWLRCWLAGATVEAIPQAVYRAHVREESRNRAPDAAARQAAHTAIYEANFGVPA